MNDATFEGLLTDYALGEMDDPDTKILLEALLERDASLRESLAEIRTTTELTVLAGAESLVGEPRSSRRALLPRSVPAAIAAVAVAAALVAGAMAWWWPTSPSEAPDDASLAQGDDQQVPPVPTEKATESATAADVVRDYSLPWLAAAVEKRSTRPNRRGAGVRWSSLVVGQAADRR